MVATAINLGIWTIIFLVAGLIKPKWPLFFMNKPDRFTVVMISTVMIMIVATLYGEGVKEQREEEKVQVQSAKTDQPMETESEADTIPTPVESVAPANQPNQ